MLLGICAMAFVGFGQHPAGAIALVATGLLLVIWRHRMRQRALGMGMAGSRETAVRHELAFHLALWGMVQTAAFVVWFPAAGHAEQALLCLCVGVSLAGGAHCVVLWRTVLPLLVAPPLLAMLWVVFQTSAGATAFGSAGWWSAAALLAIAASVVLASRLHARAVLSALDATMAQEAATHALEKQRDEAERALRVKSDFLGTMSHEIRTPLHGLLAAVELAATEAEPARQARWLASAERSGRSLLELLNAILDHARQGSGPQAVKVEPVELAEVLESTSVLFDALALRKGLALTVRVAPGARGRWQADPLLLKQVLGNLVGNAIKFTHIGCVQLELRPAAQPESAEGVIFEVADTGPGIAADALPFIFEPFYRAPEVSGTATSGAGLGLSICHKLVTAMGGTISAESLVGQGTRVRVWLPLQRSVMMPFRRTGGRHQTEAVPPATLRGRRVMLAEDNEVIALITSEILKAEGIEVRQVGDGRAACDARVRFQIDAILMDLRMPQMDGLEAARAIRRWESEHGQLRVPIIVISASVDADCVAAMREAGVDDWVEKPFTRQRLIAALHEWLPVDERLVRG